MAYGGAEADLVQQVENLGLEENEKPKLLDDPRPGLYHGDKIKEMISETLKGWCDDDPKPKIYIVTPFIDEEGLQMIKASIGDHGIEALYTRNSDGDPLEPKMEGIFVEDDFVRLRVGPHNIENQKLYYHCKFVAAEFTDRVEILMTSANLTSTHFMHEQIDSVHNKYEVTPEAFKEAYLQKLDGYSHEYEWPTTETASGEDKQKQQWKSPPKTPIVCNKCGKKGHYVNECPDVTCTKCGRKGHTSKSRKCPYREKGASKKLFQ